MSDDKEQVKEWTGSIPNLDDMYTLKTYEELERIINAWLENPDDSDGSTRGYSFSSSATPAASSSTADSSSSTSNTMKDLDEAFADLESL